MNKEIVKLISMLVVTTVLGGCGSMTPNAGLNDADRPILSAAEAKAQIRVTVRPLAPVPDQESIFAAND